MQIFQVMQKSFAILGVGEEQSLQKHVINVRNMTSLFMLCTAAILNLLHLYYEAKTFKDYATGIYSGSSLIVSVILFVIIIKDMRRMVKFLKNIEKMVNQSKFQK